jgi:hypothetical protein
MTNPDNSLLWPQRYDLLHFFCLSPDTCPCGKPLIHDYENMQEHLHCLKPIKDDCAICMEPIKSSQPLSCGHIFHIECILQSYEPLCPVCRAPILEINITSRQPKEIKEAPVFRPETSISDLSRSVLSVLVEGVEVSPSINVVLPRENINALTVERINTALMTIPGVVLISGNEIIRTIPSTISAFNDLTTILNHSYSESNTLMRNNAERQIRALINELLVSNNTGPETNVNNINFTVLYCDGKLKLDNGEINFKTHYYKTFEPILDEDCDTYIRFKFLLKNKFCTVDPHKSNCRESLNFIRYAIGTDIEVVYSQPLTDDLTIKNLSILLYHTITHTLKIFSLKSLDLFINKLNKYEKIEYFSRVVFKSAKKLLEHEIVNIDKCAYKIIKKYKNRDYLEGLLVI